MRYLLATRDKRLLAALRAAAPGDAIVGATDAAGALRAGALDAAALDGALPWAPAAEVVAVWRAARRERELVVVEPGAGRWPGLQGVERVGTRILDALRGQQAIWYDGTERALWQGGRRAQLTWSEAQVVAALAGCVAPVSARELQQRAFGHEADGAALRVHISKVRSRCRAAGIGEVIVTEGRRYRAPRLRILEGDGLRRGR